MGVQQKLFGPDRRDGFALVNVLDELGDEGVGEADAELSEIFPGRGQIVPQERDGVLKVHYYLRDIGALVPDVVYAQPGDLGHGDQGRLAGQLQVLYEQLDAVADDLVEDVLLGGEIYLVGQSWRHLLLELLLQVDGGLEAVLGRGDHAGDPRDLLFCVPGRETSSIRKSASVAIGEVCKSQSGPLQRSFVQIITF